MAYALIVLEIQGNVHGFTSGNPHIEIYRDRLGTYTISPKQDLYLDNVVDVYDLNFLHSTWSSFIKKT